MKYQMFLGACVINLLAAGMARADAPISAASLEGHTYVAKIRTHDPLPHCNLDVLAELHFISETSALATRQRCDDYRPVPGGDVEDGPFMSYGSLDERTFKTSYRISFDGYNTLVLDDLDDVPDYTLSRTSDGISLYEDDMVLQK